MVRVRGVIQMFYVLTRANSFARASTCCRQAEGSKFGVDTRVSDNIWARARVRVRKAFMDVPGLDQGDTFAGASSSSLMAGKSDPAGSPAPELLACRWL